MIIQYLSTLLALQNDKRAVTAIEYGLIAALIAVFIIGALGLVGNSLVAIFTDVSNALNAAAP